VKAKDGVEYFAIWSFCSFIDHSKCSSVFVMILVMLKFVFCDIFHAASMYRSNVNIFSCVYQCHAFTAECSFMFSCFSFAVCIRHFKLIYFILYRYLMTQLVFVRTPNLIIFSTQIAKMIELCKNYVRCTQCPPHIIYADALPCKMQMVQIVILYGDDQYQIAHFFNY